MTTPKPMTHLPNAQKTFQPPVLPTQANAFLGDVASSQHLDADKPISCGFYRLEKGAPLVYTYTYHECKIILEGSFEIADETGQSVSARPGDVFFFPKGATITFRTEEYGLAFYTGQRAEGAA
ncbi:hypothetical protein EJ05DRAFT_219237 [Pseudovirgaria hyperparasitica]|uniref:Ethanolamine utilization protein n=1 Tax=Pseudovirgaria hyperparasitica TaxID=470096 RepID=A0A6A6VUL9_9PEZI|nr:uncharacterized protein EJ05DRAFT_219237 [Pseudovirgaria hyperparasitica]KAF2753486.1 hypothetical protein EJ05DRAFT_219237 [Pseudovirgaria hyperparasitica]